MNFLDLAIVKKISGGGTPSGEIELSYDSNGTYTEDVSDYASAEITVNVSGGGGGSVAPNDVNFYDYDGTIVYSYSASDFANLTAMPANPDRTAEGLTAQGWNWSLTDAKAYVAEYGVLDVGQMYITTSGATEIDVELPEGRLSPSVGIYLNGTMEIDWGDGSPLETVSGSNAGSITLYPHIYSNAGNYTISIKPKSGTFKFQGVTGCSIFNSGVTGGKPSNYNYWTFVKRVRIGNGVTAINNYFLQGCRKLESVTIPLGVTTINGSYHFDECNNLRHITLPSGMTGISPTFQNCIGMKSTSLPLGITQIKGYGFKGCGNLKRVVIPSSVTVIGSNSLENCYKLDCCIPGSVITIDSNAFLWCVSIKEITLSDGITTISNGAFSNCCGVFSYHIKPSSPPTLPNINVFNGISPDCIIYVPAASLEAYQTATNWSTYASQMQGE